MGMEWSRLHTPWIEDIEEGQIEEHDDKTLARPCAPWGLADWLNGVEETPPPRPPGLI